MSPALVKVAAVVGFVSALAAVYACICCLDKERIRHVAGALLLCFVFAVGAATAASREMDLERVLSISDPWSMSADDFGRRFRRFGFAWESTLNRDSARTRRSGLHFKGILLIEAVADMEDDRLQGLTLIVYSRGDAGWLDRKSFEKIVSHAKTILEKANDSPGIGKKASGFDAHSHNERMVWVSGSTETALEWSYTENQEKGDAQRGFRPEYIRLCIGPFDASSGTYLLPNAPERRKIYPRITRFDLRKHVLRKADGDIFVSGVPMVDQGNKGYCVAATAERLLGYYGRDFDQHQVAQLAHVSARSGTTSAAMLSALRHIANVMEIRVDTLMESDNDEIAGTINSYNRLAEKNGGRIVDIEETPDLNSIFRAMDYETLKKARLRLSGRRKRFEADIKKHVSSGVPMAWTLMTGLVSESPPVRGVFGHMRLIVGYNPRTGEIIYSDSWGAGHEAKRMPIDDAWTVSMGLYSVLPRGTRI